MPRKLFREESDGEDDETKPPQKETTPEWKLRSELRRQAAKAEEVQEDDAENPLQAREIANEPVSHNVQGQALVRGRNRNRFDKEDEKNETVVENAASLGGKTFSTRKEFVPWISSKKQLEAERSVLYFVSTAGGTQISQDVRNWMIDRGLRVNKESGFIFANIDRALHRARVQRLHQTSFPNESSAFSLFDLSSWQALKSSAALLQNRVREPLSQHDAVFVIPFEPMKERFCRPTKRFDPSLPYLQHGNSTPVTALDAVLGRAESKSIIQLEITGLNITDHPLFIEEDYLACELLQLFRKYSRRAEVNWADFCTQKLDALQAALNICAKERALAAAQAANDVAATPVLRDNEGAIREEMRRLILQRAQEEEDDLLLVSRIIQVWERLKQVRKDQCFVSTKVDVKFKQRTMDAATDHRLRFEELEAELEELEEIYMAEMSAVREKFIAEKVKIEKLVNDAVKRVEAARAAEIKAEEAIAAANLSGDEDDDDESEGENQEPQQRASVRRRQSVEVVNPFATVQLVKNRTEEEENLRAAKALLDKHLRKEHSLEATRFDRDSAKATILARHEKRKRPPGTPTYEPILREDSSRRTETSSLPTTGQGPNEKKRREKIKSLQLSVRVLVNGGALKRADGLAPLSIALKQRCKDFDFSMQASETIQLFYVSKLPQVTLQVFEDGLISGTEIGSILLPPCNELLDHRGDSIAFQGLKPWSAPAVDQVSNEGKNTQEIVARGVMPFKQHFYMGEVSLEVHMPGVCEEYNEKPAESKQALPGSGLVSASTLKRMIKLNQIDPNDPRNAHLVDLLTSSKEVDLDQVMFDTAQFDLTLGEHIRFSTRNEKTRIDSKGRFFGEQQLSCPATLRHKILRARERGLVFGGPYWPECAIPVLDAEVEKVLWDEFFDKVYPVDIPPDEIDEVPAERQKKDRKVKFRQKIQDQFRRARANQAGGTRRKYKLRDVVHQPELPELQPFAIMEAVHHLFRKRATLRPEQRRHRVAERMPTHCNIRVTVQRAWDLPHRRAEGPSISGSTEPSHATVGDPLKCLVQARFQNQETSTPIFEGSSPAWNAPLVLPFQPPGNDWTPGKLLKVTDCLLLNVFDTRVWDKSDTQGSIRKTEKKWLGTVKIPFTTILNNENCKIDGRFELDSAPSAIGYTHIPSSQQRKGRKRGVPEESQPPQSESKMSIEVCIALDPPLQGPGAGVTEVKERLEDPVLDQCVNSWVKDCRAPAHCKGRSFDALARCLKRDWVLVTRYIHPCTPPADAFDPSLPIPSQMVQLCRFVSLIPFLEDWELDDEDIDDEIPSIWCTSKEFVVDVGAGDWEEHAALLCNFFLHLGVDSYLLFGSGTPEGRTVYVITKHQTQEGGESSFQFWNPVKGRRYDQTDPLCSLNNIFYVVNEQNVWGNIQQMQSLAATSFNFNDPLCWRPLLPQKLKDDYAMSAPEQFLTVQSEIDWNRSPPKESEAQRIEHEFKATIRNILEHWRTKDGRTMRENEGMSRKLYQILRRMEEAAHLRQTFTDKDMHNELTTSGYLNSFYITGFHINRPFTDVDVILEEIHYSDIHRGGPVQDEFNERDIQFAHSVYIKPFSRKIYSVWVAVACLAKKH